MRKSMPIFKSALMLTGVNLLLRLVGTTFQVYLSSRIGAAGIGLLQLTMSVGSLAMVAGMGGIRTASMYLTAEELGRKKPQNVTWILSGCFRYSAVCSGILALLLYVFAPGLAERWIGDLRILPALRLFAAFLPCTCLAGVMTGYFTAANQIGTLAAVEVAEQLFSMAVTMTALHFWAGTDPGRACLCVVLGGVCSGLFTLVTLLFLRLKDHAPCGTPFPVWRRLRQTAIPLAMADDLKSGISTLENLMVPKRLALYPADSDPLADFGRINGMVFPILMFPSCILFALAELLIPELARCHAANSRSRISYLVRRSLKAALLYGVLFAGILFLMAEPLCMKLYQSSEAGRNLKQYSLLVPMLYCDAITDAMTKGLGQQAACVRYNIVTSALDVFFLFLLLPCYGMKGYFVSFLLTHALNFLLSLRRLLKISGEQIPPHIPLLTFSAALIALTISVQFSNPGLQIFAYPAVLLSLLHLFGVLRAGDIQWMKAIMRKK